MALLETVMELKKQKNKKSILDKINLKKEEKRKNPHAEVLR